MQSTTLALLVKDGPLFIRYAVHDLEPILRNFNGLLS